MFIASLPQSSLAAPTIKAKGSQQSQENYSPPSGDRHQIVQSRDIEALVDIHSDVIIEPSSNQGCSSSASSSSDGDGSASASASSSSQDQGCNANASANGSNGANGVNSPEPVNSKDPSSSSTVPIRAPSSQSSIDISTSSADPTTDISPSPSSLTTSPNLTRDTTSITSSSLTTSEYVTSTSLSNSASTASTLIPTVTSAASNVDSSLNIPAIIVGSVLGSIFGVLAILGVCVGIWYYKRRRRMRRRSNPLIPSPIPWGLGRSLGNDRRNPILGEKRLRAETTVSPANEGEPAATFENRRFVIDRRVTFEERREDERGRRLGEAYRQSGIGSESPPEYSV